VTRQQRREERAALWREAHRRLKGEPHAGRGMGQSKRRIGSPGVLLACEVSRTQAADSTAQRFGVATVVEADEDRTSAALVVRVGTFALEVHPGCDMELLRRVVHTLAGASSSALRTGLHRRG
jgi:hypothetical protein